jgi:thiol:disulfide interchange protein
MMNNSLWLTLRIAFMLLLVGSVQPFQPSSNGNSLSRISRTATTSQLYTTRSAVPMEDQRPISSFQQRMLNRRQQTTEESRPHQPPAHSNKKFSLVQEVRTLADFKTVVIDEANGKMVAVWFYAPWCRSCKATAPGFFALAKHHPEVKFVQVAVSHENTSLHQGLGVPSVPFCHLYHPNGGLVEERKLTRKFLPGFHKQLKDYIEGSCSLELINKEWSTASPYDPSPKASKDSEGTSLRSP